ncbi:uncharacterized protein [Physcomitrium patens]|uniref:uncharacterized protein isoform X4 n=1 Tax=Physcomitrium patens TaxID=3218 RepID=UPI003CCDA24A
MGDEVHVTVNYYARVGYGHHIQSYCTHLLLKRPREPILLFWHAYGLILEGSYSEALLEMEPLQDHRELQVAVLAAMLYSHERSPSPDTDTIHTLRRRLETVDQNASERALVLAATLYWHLGGSTHIRNSYDLVTRVLRVQPQYTQAQCLLGWLCLGDTHIRHRVESDIPSVDWKTADKSLVHFAEVLSKGSNAEALMGRAFYHELKENYTEALADLSQVTILHAWFLPAVLEKARMGLLLRDFDLAHETSQQILQKDPNNIDGLRMAIHLHLCSDNNQSTAAGLLADLLRSIEQREPQNAYLCLEVVRSIARLAGRCRVLVLQKTMAIIERARQLNPKESAFVVELADQLFLLEDYKTALATYKSTANMDEVNMEAMYGAVQCLVVLGDFDDAEQQLEFLAEVSVSTGKSASLPYLMAQQCWRKQRNGLRCRDLLDESMGIQTKRMRHQHDFTFYADLNPNRRLGIAHLYMTISRYECMGPHVEENYSLLRAADILEQLIGLVPGLMDAHLMLARVFFLLADWEAAQRSIQSAIALDLGCSSAHLLLAQVLRSARSLPEMEHIGKESSYYTSRKHVETTDTDRVMVFLLLVEVHTQFGRFPEAAKAVEDAMAGFSGTPEEMRVVLSNCDLALCRGDVPAAIAMLSQIPRESNYYVQARIKLADVYLKHQHNRVLYSKCYTEITQLHPNAKTYMLLGEALMKVDEPEEAMRAFEVARKKSPLNATVSKKVGQALVASYEYRKAVEHYEDTLASNKESPDKLELLYDFGDLNFKLRNYKRSAEVLCELLANVDNGSMERSFKNGKMLMLCLKASLLLSKVQNVQGQQNSSQGTPEAINNRSKYLHHYKVMFKARDLFNNYLVELQGQHCDAIKEQKHVAADIYFQFAHVFFTYLSYTQGCEANNDADKAILLLNEALKCNPAHSAASVALAKILLARGDVGECEQRCAALLRENLFYDEAGDILVYLMIQRELYESAIMHYQQILERDPNHYSALSQLIRLFRRTGRLEEINQNLSNAEKATPAATFHAGLNFCKGLVALHSNKPYEAIMLLNTARTDYDWGKPALFVMVEIYLNIENNLGFEEGNLEGNTSPNDEAIKVAQKLLSESRNLEGNTVKQSVLECYASMATRHKDDVENALVKLQELSSQDSTLREKERVCTMLAIATGLTLLRQTAKAKNQLRAIDRMPYKWDDGDDFERAWLMLAYIHLQAGKQEASEELCKKCLKYNKECSKAWELLGWIMEKNHSYPEAVGFYENAWKCLKESSPAVGYRLAYMYLKDKRHIEAIIVCQKVLQISPNYPKIKKDILEKARVCVRA